MEDHSGVLVGTRAKFFHPATLGVMHWGTVKKAHKDGSVTVEFEVTFKGKTRFRTYPDRIREEP